MLYIYGGVYLDVDLKQKKSLDNIIMETNNADFITSFGLGNNITRMNEEEFKQNNQIYHPILCNWFLFSIPKNNILLDLIKKIITLPLKNRHSVNIYYFHTFVVKVNKYNRLQFSKKITCPAAQK